MTDGSINHQKRFLLHITVSIEKKTASPGTICDDKETAMGYAIFVSQSSTCVRIIQAVSSCCEVTSDAQNAKPVGLPKPREPPHTSNGLSVAVLRFKSEKHISGHKLVR